jgi:hypothetical protein
LTISNLQRKFIILVNRNSTLLQETSSNLSGRETQDINIGKRKKKMRNNVKRMQQPRVNVKQQKPIKNISKNTEKK